MATILKMNVKTDLASTDASDPAARELRMEFFCTNPPIGTALQLQPFGAAEPVTNASQASLQSAITKWEPTARANLLDQVNAMLEQNERYI